MFQYGAIERYGTGTLDIYKLINQSGLKDPDFHLKEGFMVVLWRPSVGTDHVTDYVTDHVTDHVITGISDLTHRLVVILDDEMSRQELMNILSLKHIPTFRENYLTPALEGGLIEMTLPNTPKSVKQKYRLTDKGVEIRKKIENHGKQN